MAFFRCLLLIMFLVLFGYTLLVMREHGMGLLQVFFSDMAKMNWPGQFNLDFFMMLILSGLWTSWRNEFTPKGIVLGFLALFGGALFLTVYLSYLVITTQGNIVAILIGARRQST